MGDSGVARAHHKGQGLEPVHSKMVHYHEPPAVIIVLLQNYARNVQQTIVHEGVGRINDYDLHPLQEHHALHGVLVIGSSQPGAC